MNVLPPSIFFHLFQRFNCSYISRMFAWNTETDACHRHGIRCTAEEVYKERLLSRGAGVKQAGCCCVLLQIAELAELLSWWPSPEFCQAGNSRHFACAGSPDRDTLLCSCSLLYDMVNGATRGGLPASVATYRLGYPDCLEKPSLFVPYSMKENWLRAGFFQATVAPSDHEDICCPPYCCCGAISVWSSHGLPVSVDLDHR